MPCGCLSGVGACNVYTGLGEPDVRKEEMQKT